jgi:hypothetical protein
MQFSWSLHPTENGPKPLPQRLCFQMMATFTEMLLHLLRPKSNGREAHVRVDPGSVEEIIETRVLLAHKTRCNIGARIFNGRHVGSDPRRQVLHRVGRCLDPHHVIGTCSQQRLLVNDSRRRGMARSRKRGARTPLPMTPSVDAPDLSHLRPSQLLVFQSSNEAGNPTGIRRRDSRHSHTCRSVVRRPSRQTSHLIA